MAQFFFGTIDQAVFEGSGAAIGNHPKFTYSGGISIYNAYRGHDYVFDFFAKDGIFDFGDDQLPYTELPKDDIGKIFLTNLDTGEMFSVMGLKNVTMKDFVSAKNAISFEKKLFAGDDTIYTNHSRAQINAGKGDDTIYVISGKQTLSGGLGNDVFVYNNNSVVESYSKTTRDVIVDFVKRQDHIDFSKNDYAEDFHFVGKRAPISAGNIGYRKAGGGVDIYVNLDDDRSAEVVIHLDGILKLSENDFIL